MTILANGAPLHIANGIREFAIATPNSVAVIDGDRTLTYRELDERSSRFARVLSTLGLQRGDRVAVLLGNRLEYCELAAGIAKAGLCMVPVNPRLTSPEITYILRHSQTQALVLDDALARVAHELLDRQA
jgi:long-chain acyl-CoA synthetase